ncbi:hypothetical protein HPB52_002854 [Rhipicephalus sanguineus]|uniref:Gustatory receptor n=1 Tax=Rhipicephalus sanguineus TaxID=34632 RepID=A0A9D4QFQ9_RHISA|nr:hypothetical protein HPB52_002854 [Rhipicephalus sanguineus]
MLNKWQVAIPRSEGMSHGISHVSVFGARDSELARLKSRRRVHPSAVKDDKYVVWRAQELMIPGLLMCAVAMPGPFLQFMSSRNKALMRMYQCLLYVGFSAYEAYRLKEFVEDYMSSEKTSLICFFHSLVNTFLFPFIYAYVARRSASLDLLLTTWREESGDVAFSQHRCLAKHRLLAGAYLAATVLLVLGFHTLNTVRVCFEMSWRYSDRTLPIKAVIFLGKTAHHYVLQTMYCGLESLAFSLMFLLWMLSSHLTAQVKDIPLLTTATVALIREKYRRLCVVVESTARFLNCLLFLFFFRTAFDFMSSVIFYSIQDGRETKLWILAYEGLLTLINVFQNTAIAEMSGKLSSEMSTALYEVSKVPAMPEAYNDLLLFLHVYKEKPEAMAGCGVLRVDRALMFKLSGSTVTIVLILFQLDPNLSNKVSF